LLEKIAAVALILVLLLITYATLSRAHRQGQVTTTLSHLRQLYQANALYTANHDDLFLPLNLASGSGPPQMERFKQALLPYTTNEAFYSPLDKYAGKPCPSLNGPNLCEISSFELQPLLNEASQRKEPGSQLLLTSWPEILSWRTGDQPALFLSSVLLSDPVVLGVNGENLQTNRTNMGENIALLFVDGSTRFVPLSEFASDGRRGGSLGLR
jgi:hypothetical protein